MAQCIKPTHNPLNKVNMYGSSFKNPESVGFGGLIHDKNFLKVVSFSSHTGISANMHTKLEAIHPSLLIAMELGDIKFEFESNSLETANLIKVGDTSTHEFETIISDIRHMLATRPSIVVRHVFRETNSCAYTLAKMGARDTICLCLWKAPSLKFYLMLRADFTSTVFVICKLYVLCFFFVVSFSLDYTQKKLVGITTQFNE